MKRKRKTTFLSVMLMIALLFICYKPIHALSYYINANNINVLCPANLGIGFQNNINNFVNLNVDSGLLNCSDGRLRIYDGGGNFRFTALNDTMLTINYTVDQVKVQGDQNRASRILPSGNSITVQTGNNVFITWSITIEPLLPLMFILGIFGLCGIIGGCLYTIDRIKKHDTYNGLVNGLIIVSLGISLFLAWLWAGVTV